MDHKTIVITGATDGIGKETAFELAHENTSLILVGKNTDKGNAVMQEVQSTTSNDRIHFYTADLSQMAQIRRLGASLKKDFDRIDVLINNAGCYFAKYENTSEGLEKTFALNHMNYFLLSKELLPVMKDAPAGRIINVASDAHRGKKMDWNNVQGDNGYHGWQAYGRSKLMNIMFTYELARRISGGSVTANCLHPGFVKSKFGENNSGVVGWGMKLAKAAGAISLHKGAETSVYLALSSEVENVSGKYFSKKA